MKISYQTKHLGNILFFLLILFIIPLSVYAGKSIRVMPLGDSITYGNNIYNPPNSAKSVSYRKLLWDKLKDNNYTVDFVGSKIGGTDFASFDPENEGHPGDTAAGIAVDVYQYLINNPADIILLHIGTNNLSTNPEDINTILDEIDRYESDYKTHIQVILARIINRWVEWTDENGNSRSIEQDKADTSLFNKNLEIMAQERIKNGDDIVIVDMEHAAGLIYNNTDMIDDLHPQKSGFLKIANIWYRALQKSIPLHQWHFNESDDATNYIDTYRDNTGICTGKSCPTIVSGRVGNALRFNGTDTEITIPNDDTFDWENNESFTIEYWIKPNRTKGTNQVIIGRENKLKNSYYWWTGIVGSDGHITFRMRDSNNTLISVEGPVLHTDTWYHVACIRDAKTKQNLLYINGVLAASNHTVYTGNFIGTTSVNIGYLTFQGNKNFYLQSTLDELTIYAGALDEKQILLHYRGETGNNSKFNIISVPVTSAQVGKQYVYNIKSNDPSAFYTYSADPEQEWMHIDSDSGLLTGTPAKEAIGNIAITTEAIKSDKTAIQKYILKIRNRASLPDGMIHYWKLDENETSETKVYIDSYSGADGICSGADCPTPRHGKVNGAQSFNGHNKINITNTSSFDWDTNSSFTIEYWIRIDRGTDISKNMVVLGRDGLTSSFTWWTGIIHSTGHSFFRLRDSNGHAIAVQSKHSIVGDNHAGHHIAIVRNGETGEISLYVDGKLEETKHYTFTGIFTENHAPAVNIGYLNFNGTPNFFLNNGSSGIDDIAVFNRAMDKTEINTHFQNSASGKSFETILSIPTSSRYSRQNNIVTDHQMNLQWQDTTYSSAELDAYNSTLTEDQTGKAKKWINAEEYCNHLDLNGEGWRLPTIDELNSIVDTNYINPALNPIFQNAPGLGTWSGTTYVDNTSQAWGVGFYGGGLHHCNKDGRIKLIRCVRTYTETPVNNIPPIAVAGPDQNSTEGDLITLDGSESSDPDGSIVSYLWKENSIILSNDVSFDKTDFSVGTHIVTLTVTDNDGASTSDNVEITIHGKPPVPGNTLPTANAGKDKSIVLGNSVTLRGRGTDADGTIESYVWTKDSTIIANTSSFEYTPTEAGTDTFTLTVTDNDGATASDIMNVLVTDNSTPPPAEEFNSDDFSSDTLADYTTSGNGSWSYDKDNEQVLVSSRGRTGYSFSHAISPSEEGTFSFTVIPLHKNSSTGLIELRLEENANTYYRIVDRDGDISGGITKYVNGTRVAAKWFRRGFSQGKNYTVSVTFDHGVATVHAFGQTLIMNKNKTSINVSAFTIRMKNQDSIIDDIQYN